MSELLTIAKWDQFEIRMGRLPIAAGYPEMAIAAMVARILNKDEKKVAELNNDVLCDKLSRMLPHRGLKAIGKRRRGN